MNRFAFAATAVCLISALTPSPAASQTKPAAQTAATPAPAAPAKWVPPIKGTATVEYIQAKPKRVKGNIESSFKLKNVSKGAIALLSVEEIWYNTKREIASNASTDTEPCSIREKSSSSRSFLRRNQTSTRTC
jgi:hypothetical protein